MNQHVIQLSVDIAIIVNDVEFRRARRQFKSIFHWSRFLTIEDIRGHKMTTRKKNILLFEESVNEKEKKYQEAG